MPHPNRMIPEGKSRRFIDILRPVFAVLVVATVAATIFLTPLRDILTYSKIMAFVETLRGQAWAVWLFYALFSLLILVVPVTIFPIIGGVLFGFWVALPLNLAATLVGASLSFGISRTLGHKAMASFLEKRLPRLNRWTKKKGVRAVCLIRWMGFPPFMVANYAFGLSAVRYKHFFLGTLVGILPWTILVTYMANSFWEALLVGGQAGFKTALAQNLLPLSFVSAGVFLTVLTTLLLQKKSRQPQSL